MKMAAEALTDSLVLHLQVLLLASGIYTRVHAIRLSLRSRTHPDSHQIRTRTSIKWVFFVRNKPKCSYCSRTGSCTSSFLGGKRRVIPKYVEKAFWESGWRRHRCSLGAKCQANLVRISCAPSFSHPALTSLCICLPTDVI